VPAELTPALSLFNEEQLIHGAGLAWRSFDVGASTMWAVTGALLAAKRGYDLSGMFAIALVSSTGGGLLRDGLFLQSGPPRLVRSPVYIAIAALASLLVWAFARKMQGLRFERAALWADAIGLGGFAVVGMQLSLAAGLSVPGVVLVGVVNAVGGGVMRSLLMLRIPEVFRPGEWTAFAALGGCVLYVLLTVGAGIDQQLAAAPTLGLVALLRWASIRYKLHTRAALGFETDETE
jgi:uncharacterized membrane protein YeiH